MCKLKLWKVKRRWLESLTELICWKWCQKPLQNQFKVIHCLKLKSLPHLELNYKATENMSWIFLLRVNKCTLCCCESPLEVGNVYSLTQSNNLTSCWHETLSAIGHETDRNLWGIMKAKSDSLWRKRGGGQQKKTTWMTTCQNERLPLLTLLQARNGN